MGGLGLAFDPRLFLGISSLHAMLCPPIFSLLLPLPWATAEHPVGAVLGGWQSIHAAWSYCTQGSLQPMSRVRGLQH